MLDIKFIRENPDKVKKGARVKGVDVDVEKLLELDKKRRKFLEKIEKIRAEKNKASKRIVVVKNDKEKNEIIARMRSLDKEYDNLKKDFKKIDKEFYKIMALIPNLPLDGVPIGKDEKENIVIRQVGKRKKFSFKPKDYLSLGEKLDLIDVKRASKVAGSRFGYLKKEAVLLEFALISFVLDILKKEGFIPVLPPVMLKPEMAWAMGYLEQDDRDEAYFIPKDNLYLIGTAEQSIGAMHAGEIFNEKDLPKRYAGFSTCFRREAGSYGKDTKGIFRVHQFDKLEMFSFCKPDESIKEHKFLLSLEEKIMKLLEIPYQVVHICTGDLGRPAAEKYDIEAWLPSEEKYRETHSTSNCTDFQARRLNIRYREKSGKLKFVHTLNGTGLAMGRTIIMILENYQQKDGSIRVPRVLQKYLDFKVIR